MTEANWVQLASTISGVGMPGLLVLILISGYFQKWVWGHQLLSMKQDRDFWRTAALRQTNLLERTVDGRKEESLP